MVISRQIIDADAEVSFDGPRFAYGKTAFPVLGRQNNLSVLAARPYLPFEKFCNADNSRIND